jgi:hypothetical protein
MAIASALVSRYRGTAGMKSSNHRIFAMKFASVYPLYVQEAERGNRTKAEVHSVGCQNAGAAGKIKCQAHTPACAPLSSAVRAHDVADPSRNLR